ncbi:MAG TPA: FxLYD domain-containing protein, partial [Thermoanaerobaculia bacterium]|nr:FxLYD domain-containing protein [Thermoanaerobaculia bacterium]
DVVVLRGGTRIDLKQAPVRQGNNALLTRADGTLLMVPISEIDQQATAAARAAAAAPRPAASASAAAAPETPAEAARVARDGPKARVRLTDADVGHYLDSGETSGEEKKEEGGAESSPVAGAHVDVAEYSQSKSGDNLIVKGTLRNLGSAAALNTRLTVTPIDEKGQTIDSAEASVSNGTLEAGRSVNFSATIPIGSRNVGTMRFSPRWITQAPPAEAAAAAAASKSAPGAPGAAPVVATASKPPAPAPTPYGQGMLYAAPPASAPMERPADGKSGYIPGAADPANQPKTPE